MGPCALWRLAALECRPIVNVQCCGHLGGGAAGHGAAGGASRLGGAGHGRGGHRGCLCEPTTRDELVRGPIEGRGARLGAHSALPNQHCAPHSPRLPFPWQCDPEPSPSLQAARGGRRGANGASAALELSGRSQAQRMGVNQPLTQNRCGAGYAGRDRRPAASPQCEPPAGGGRRQTALHDAGSAAALSPLPLLPLPSPPHRNKRRRDEAAVGGKAGATGASNKRCARARAGSKRHSPPPRRRCCPHAGCPALACAAPQRGPVPLRLLPQGPELHAAGQVRGLQGLRPLPRVLQVRLPARPQANSGGCWDTAVSQLSAAVWPVKAWQGWPAPSAFRGPLLNRCPPALRARPAAWA